nr:EOG090X0GO7 [Ilyocryptus agilis]
MVRLVSGVKLASTIDTGMTNIGLYIDLKPQKEEICQSGQSNQPNTIENDSSEVDKLMEKSVLKPGFERLQAVPKYSVSMRQAKLQKRKKAAKTKGDKWFNLPAAKMTEEKFRDLQVIQMRSILDPKQFYKKNDLKVLPKYFQVGTVVDNAADFYHSRVPKKDRKKTLVDELMADANFQRYNKRKYAEILQNQPKTADKNHSLFKNDKKKLKY